ncbi:Coenzyme F420 hydrogenase/dehydrogenase, beta subunit C-terminal domain [uncultured Fusobacterium sp.]|uniref:Coenzyme F420 hydrogenase/dehydrogenase, beta subunit C-terminal domain n=1 Tax=uncultured Fusobacterium sp. TaxID=159267 RepID=UPI002593007F|nr:Coenzyme F420 hydrogenase/dehydrogenase, beta subunit C-terminal domain [uncultured Fusobacterium sp.]
MNNIDDMKGKNYCTSCGMCSAICPKDAIQITLDNNGFYRPVINEELCIHCGICKQICYKYDENYSKEKIKFHPICLSAKNKNKNELHNASSGAVSIELMKICLELGYKVVGVKYDYEKDTAVSKIASTNHELLGFRGSKYFQSYTEDAFKQVMKDNSKQKYAIFGTPCQIYAFSKAAELRRRQDKFLLIDIFCHGCPSINLWSKYIKDIKEKIKLSKFDLIKFRSKTYFWHEFCFDFKSGNKKFTSSKYGDPFYELFFGMDIMNEACYNCIARSSMVKTDIRLGDFWGWQYDLDKEGVSAVVINSEKGKEIFNRVIDKFIIKEFSFKEIIEAQSYGKEHNYDKQRRLVVLEDLNSNLSMRRIQKKYRKMLPISNQLKRMLKNFLKIFLGDFYIKLRQKKHKKI